MQKILTILLFIILTTQLTIAQQSIETLDSLAKLSYYEENLPKALGYYEKMLQKIQAKNAIGQYAWNVKYAAILYLEMGQYEKAEQLYLQLIQYNKKNNQTNTLLHIQSLGSLAYCCYAMGRYEEAESLYLSALELGEKVLEVNAPVHTSNINNLAILYNAMGRYEEAEQLYLQILEIDKRNTKSQRYYASSLNNLAALYYEMGRYLESKDLYLKAQEINKNIYGEDHPNYALGLNNTAALYEKIGLHFEAEALYEASRKILGKNNPNYVHSLSASANLYFHQKEYKKAKKLWLEALEWTSQNIGKKHPAYAQYLDRLANLYLRENQIDTAWNYCIKGILANIQNDSFTSINQLDKFLYLSNERAIESLVTLLNISKEMYLQNRTKENLQQVYEISTTAIRLNERIRRDFVSSGNKLRLLQKNNIFVQNGIQTILDLQNKNLYAEAFALAEQNKSVLLADAFKGQRARTLGDLPDSLALLELNLQNEKENLQQAQFKATSISEKTNIAASLNKVNSDINTFVKSLQDKYPKYHALKYAQNKLQVQDIQALLDDNTLWLEYFVAPEATYLFVVDKKSVSIVPILIVKERIAAQISALRESLSNYDFIADSKEESYLLFTKSADWLYKNLLEKALNNRSVENLIIIPDGELGHIPFEVLLTQSEPQAPTDYDKLHYLVKKYNISYNYSASLWKENKTRSKAILGSKQNEILAFAATYIPPADSLLELRPQHLFNLRHSLQALPAAEEEVNALAWSFRGKFLKGTAANEAYFKEHAAEYGVIHLAMHGILNEQHPMLSSLAFSEDNNSKEDNFLQAYEISQMQLNANLVVLSACETGYGKFEQGEGVISLARAFMYAGVPSVVMSLWHVNDQATAIMMRFFYENLAKGMDKAAALRQAKLKYLEKYKGMASHPALWSAFVLLGDSSLIKIQTKSSWFWWGLGTGVLVLLIGTRMILRRRKKISTP